VLLQLQSTRVGLQFWKVRTGA